jgi:hypothetical protein
LTPGDAVVIELPPLPLPAGKIGDQEFGKGRHSDAKIHIEENGLLKGNKGVPAGEGCCGWEKDAEEAGTRFPRLLRGLSLSGTAKWTGSSRYQVKILRKIKRPHSCKNNGGLYI